jgi:hypothetical protein
MTGVGEAQDQLELLARDRGRPAGADDLQVLLVALGDALDHVADQGAGGAPVGVGLRCPCPVLDRDLDGLLASVQVTLDLGAELHRELALGAFDLDDAGP